MGQMTRKEKLMKTWLIRKLKSQGYLTYAKILREFDVNAWPRDYGGVAAMDPNNGVFYINEGVDDEQASTLIRHEILHEFLKHQKRAVDYLARERGIDLNNLTEDELSKLNKDVFEDKVFLPTEVNPQTGQQNGFAGHIGNLAGDMDLSNKGYTEKDKEIVRSIKVNGKVVSGMVTEDINPEWVDMSFEDLYTELAKLRKKEEKQQPQEPVVLGVLEDPETFISVDGRKFGI